MNFELDERLWEAVRETKQFINMYLLDEYGCRDEMSIYLKSIIKGIEKYLKCKIFLKSGDFSQILKNPSYYYSGVMMKVLGEEDKIKEATVLDNSLRRSNIQRTFNAYGGVDREKYPHLYNSLLGELNVEFIMQRFFIAHELGHLVLKSYSSEYLDLSSKTYTISVAASPDITYITDEGFDDKFMLAEQSANIFALMTLIPEDLLIKDINDYGASTLCSNYRVTEEMLVSRIYLTQQISSVPGYKMCLLDRKKVRS